MSAIKYIFGMIVSNGITTVLFYKYLYQPLLLTVKNLQCQLLHKELEIDRLKESVDIESKKSIELNKTLTKYFEENYNILE